MSPGTGEMRDWSGGAVAGLGLEAPAVQPHEVLQRLETLAAARQKLLRRSVQSILRSLEAAVDLWCTPQSTWRRTAESALPDATGFSPAMIHRALPLLFEPLQDGQIGQLLDDELGSRRVIDGERSGPHLIVHVIAGNLPGQAIVPMALSLALKSAVLVKAPAGERICPELFARSLAEVDPEIGAAVAPCYWRGGDRACEAAAFRAAGLVIASGSDRSIEEMRARCPAPFIGYGHRVSFALVGREISEPELAQSTARSLALDVTLWDQRGCLSPQVCFVEGDFEAACRFADLVASALAALARELPPGRLTVEEHASVQRFRAEAQWQEMAGHPVALFASGGSTHWTVVVDSASELRPTPLCRSLRITAIPAIADLGRLLRPARRHLEAAGLAVSDSRLDETEALLHASGVHRVCPIGRMQRPPLSWRPGGRSRVAGWMEAASA